VLENARTSLGSSVVNRIRNNICFCDVAGDEITLRPLTSNTYGTTAKPNAAYPYRLVWLVRVRYKVVLA
jgi:hypothetical protein